MRLLCAGPGRLCQALAITREQDGRALDEPPFALEPRGAPVDIAPGLRIGITRAADLPWRSSKRARHSSVGKIPKDATTRY